MEASVVDLPEPVGPVTSTNPRGLSQSLATTAGRPNWLNDLISNGMSRNTAEVAPRWLNTLARKRASPFRPNEKSSSRFSSRRCFCESVMTLYASCLVSAGVNCGRSSGTRCPCTRICGGELLVMWRSLPCISSIRFKRSLNASAIGIVPLLCPNSVNCFAGHFFQGCHTLRNFDQSAAAEGDRAALDCLLLQLHS